MLKLIEKVDASLPKYCGDRLLSYDFKGDPKIYIWKYGKDKVEEKNIVMPIEAILKVNDNYFVCDDDEGSLFVTDIEFESFEPVFEDYVSPLNNYLFDERIYTVLKDKSDRQKRILYDLSNSKIVRTIEVDEWILNEYTFQFNSKGDGYILVVRDFLTAEILWEIAIEKVSEKRPLFSIIGIKQDLFVFTLKHITYGIHLKSGRKIWESYDDYLCHSQISIHDNSLISFKRNFIKYDLFTGEIIYKDLDFDIAGESNNVGSRYFLQLGDYLITVNPTNKIIIYNLSNKSVYHIREEPKVKRFVLSYRLEYLHDKLFVLADDLQLCVFMLDDVLLKELNGG